MTELQRAHHVSITLSDWIGVHLGQTGPATMKGQIATALFSICLDHREAVVLLVGAGARTTAQATVRSVFESYVRGLWAAEVATDEALLRFIEGKMSSSEPKVSSAIQALRKIDGSADLFERIRITNWASMCDYAHGSARQVSRWISRDGIEPRHRDDEMVEILRFVDKIGLLACISREALAERSADLFLHKLQELLGHVGQLEGQSQEAQKPPGPGA